jgi:sRNA-binding protein
LPIALVAVVARPVPKQPITMQVHLMQVYWYVMKAEAERTMREGAVAGAALEGSRAQHADDERAGAEQRQQVPETMPRRPG